MTSKLSYDDLIDLPPGDPPDPPPDPPPQADEAEDKWREDGAGGLLERLGVDDLTPEDF